MNRNSNTYTILYAAILVIVAAAALSVASLVLKPAQEMNKEIEKKSDILRSVGKLQDLSKAPNKNEYVAAEYEKYIVESYLVDMQGERRDGDAFTTDVKAQLAKPENERLLPVYVYKEGAKLNYVFPLYGTGLWGPIWGYIALESDFNTVSGATFDHDGETPGLGAEIATPSFYNQFKGKTLFENGQLVSVHVQKPGMGNLNAHTVDGISGGTITSKAVETMLLNNLQNYQAFFAKNKPVETPKTPVAPEAGQENEENNDTPESN